MRGRPLDQRQGRPALEGDGAVEELPAGAAPVVEVGVRDDEQRDRLRPRIAGLPRATGASRRPRTEQLQRGTGVTTLALGIEPSLQGGSHVRPRRSDRVVAGLLDGLLQPPAGVGKLRTLGVDPGEEHQRLDARRPRGEPLHPAAGRLARLGECAGVEPALGHGQLAAHEGRRVLRRRQVGGKLREVRRCGSAAAAPRHGRRLVEHDRDGLVRAGHGERAVASLLLWTIECRRDPGVERSPSAREGCGIGHGADQRVGAREQFPVAAHEVGDDQLVERRRLIAEHPLDAGGRRMGHGSDDEEQFPGRPGDVDEAALDQRCGVAGRTQWLAGSRQPAPRRDRACDLHGKQRVVGGDGVDPGHHGARQRRTGPQRDDTPEGADAQRSGSHDDSSLLGDRPDHGGSGGGSGRRQHDHRRGGHASKGEGDDSCARLVKPLEVVHRHDNRAHPGEPLEHGPEREPKHHLVDRIGRPDSAQERRVEHPTSCSRDPASHLVQQSIRQQLGQARERERPLGFGGSHLEHPHAGGPCRLDAAPPERGLADARSSLDEDERTGARADRGLDPFALDVPSDHHVGPFVHPRLLRRIVAGGGGPNP